MKSVSRRLRLLGAVVVFWPLSLLAAPHVVVSLAPLHSLAASVTEGVSEPTLLYHRQQSPHGAGLSPDQLRLLTQADLLVWVGPELETGLSRLASRLPNGAVDWRWHDYDAGMNQYETRPALFETDAEALYGEHDHGRMDPHFWLDPRNAQAFVINLAEELAQLDPANAERYRANATAEQTRLGDLFNQLDAQLAPVRDKPFIVFHDGFQYYQRAFGLNALGALVVTPEIPPGPRTVAQLAERANQVDGVCLLHEPQFSERWLQPLAAAVPNARLAQIDPIGSTLDAGDDFYARVLIDLTDHLSDCLEQLP
ncbi:zinc ABC transporter substrate-binding protein [Saccharospirillum mangrovi]|uniref:zinc ABC transporter substrate-binding protein n=1 Tax=Saccharospirillum mangrovi TaxID=2161747 RepID=UPI00130045D3|nr:zinc ABC transporter substrate-binding protein [Saccharospirillum mangrovi]